jgi:polysaccharide export outer membrane protein
MFLYRISQVGAIDLNRRHDIHPYRHRPVRMNHPYQQIPLAVLVLAFCAPLLAQSPAPVAPTPRAEPSRPSILNNSNPASGVAINPLPASVSAPAGYVLSANDQISVEVFGEDDLRTSGRLNAEGNFSVPLLGSIHLGGLTLTQAAAKLTELYGRDYLVNPRVNVMLVGYARRRFTVLGQVNRPGSYELPEGAQDGIDVLEAIAMAGGYTRIAAPERISVRRKRTNGADEVIRVDAKRLARSAGQSFTVVSGDTVTVGESLF